MTTLDAAASNMRLRLIKMDVEGYEAKVIAGASRTLAAPDLLAVISESDDPGVSEPLRERGFLPLPTMRSVAGSSRRRSAPNRASAITCSFANPRAVSRRLLDAPRRLVVGIEI